MQILWLLRFVSNKNYINKDYYVEIFYPCNGLMPSAVVIAQSIAKVLAPICFQNEAPDFECVIEHVLDQHVIKMHWNSKCVPKHIEKQGPHFENMLQGLTHSYNNR